MVKEFRRKLSLFDTMLDRDTHTDTHFATAYAAHMHSIAWVTRSQAVARIADRTAPQHLSGSRDVIGHVSIWFPRWSFPIGGFFGTKPLSLTVSDIFNGKC